MPYLRSLLLIGLLLLGASSALAQEPKTGNAWYEDAVDLGFKVKAPRDWQFVPGSPLDRNLIGNYAASNGADVALGKDAILTVSMFLVKFDRRAATNAPEERQIGDQKVEFKPQGFKDIGEWMLRGIDQGSAWRKVEDLKPLKAALEAKVAVYEGTSTRLSGGSQSTHVAQPIRAYVAQFALSPEVDVALVGLGPGDKKKWRTFESAYASIAKTLQPVTVEGRTGEVGKDPRSQKRAKLEMEVAKSPGWRLYETPNYFVVSCHEDADFIEELKLRLEAIRLVYEQDYPPEMSRKIKVVESHEGEGGDAEGGAEEPAQPDPNRTVGAIDALELGKCSVVRVCKDRDQYEQYGGRQGTSGYFSSMEEELLVFDDKQDEGRDATWAVLNHEGFHQYIFAFFGNVSPHSWYNEGTGDYYSGFDFNLKTKRFTRRQNKGRMDNLLIIRRDYVPLVDFVKWTQAQYYGGNKGNGRGGPTLEGWACYAQGWSMIWFLRTGAEGKAKGWKKEWGTILDKYLVALLETGEVDEALAKGFEGVDYDALEASWKDYLGL